ncbi:MAG TPA: hypothetical protein VF019_05080 [Nitrospira sp.]
MHYDTIIFGLSLLAASFLFGKYLSPISDASRLRSHDDSAVNDVEQCPLAMAIKALTERNGLGEILAADTTTIPGQLIWRRTLVGKTRGIRFASPDSAQTEYILSYFEKDGDVVVDGKWMWDLEHSVAAFARFLIEWEDLRNISKDSVEYLQQQVKTT